MNAARPIVVNLMTRFTVYCPTCHRADNLDSLLEAEHAREHHVCEDAARSPASRTWSPKRPSTRFSLTLPVAYSVEDGVAQGC